MRARSLLLFVSLWIAGVVSFASPAQAGQKGEFTPEQDAIIREKWPEAIEMPSGMRYIVLKAGDGPIPRLRQRCVALYEGGFLDGTVFDAKQDPEDPFVFVVGANRVIAGWDQAFMNMKVGEKRLLIIPYALAYGLRGRPPDIPPRAALVFTVELLGIE